MKMDGCLVDKMKLSKYGFKLNLIVFSTFLSIFGIVVSSLGTLGGIAVLLVGILDTGYSWILLGGVILLLMISYLAMWILLKVKTNRKDITSIERIGNLYSYVSGALEIMAMVGWLYNLLTHIMYHQYAFGIETFNYIAGLLYTPINLVFACLKIHGIRLERNQLLGIYLGYRYTSSIIFIWDLVSL